MDPTPFSWKPSWLYLAALAPISYTVSQVIYRLFLTPLRSIPGPWYTAVSNIWFNSHAIRLQTSVAVESIFQKYGPVVRIGPNFVAFKDIPTMRTVYGTTSKYAKGDIYSTLLTYDNDNIITFLETGPHNARRKRFAPHYFAAHLALYQSEMHDFVIQVVHALEGIAGKRSVDTLTLFRSLLVDTMFAITYNDTIEAVKNWTPGSEHPMSLAIHDFPPRALAKHVTPTWLFGIISRLPVPRWRQVFNCEDTLTKYIVPKVAQVRQQLREEKEDSKPESGDKISLLSRLLRHGDQEPLTDKEIISECMIHSIAAVDSTSTAASYLCWELSRRPDIARKLQAELDPIIPDGHLLPGIKVLQELPYLDAVVKEALRVHAIAPGLLARVVPKGGLTVLGYYIPAGTTVATQSRTLHRDKDVFPNPHYFHPDRWFNPTDEMNSHLIPFGYGSRMCAGQNLGMMELKILMAALSRNFDIFSPPETTEESMHPREALVRLLLASFTPQLS